MLTIPVHENQDIPGRYPYTALDGRPVSNVIGMAEDNSTDCFGHLRGVIRRPVVDNDNLVIGIDCGDLPYDLADIFRFIKNRNDD